MATFRKLPNGRWEAAISVAGRRKSKTHDTKAKARSWAAQIELQFGRGDGVAGDYILGELFREYAEKVSGKKKGSRWEIIRLQRFETYAFARLRLLNVQREDIEDWVERRLQEVKPSSVNRELNLLSHCFTQARRWRWMAHNPMKDLHRPKNPPHRERLITTDEIETILVAAGYSEELPVVTQKQKAAVAFLVAIETAMRAGELCSLHEMHINYENRTAYLADTKNGHPRLVPLSSEAIRLLKRLPASENGPIFGMAAGTLSTHFKNIVTDTGIEGLTFHDTRHEAITRLATKLDVLALARAVGHKNIKQLMTYYNQSAAELAKLLD